MFMAVVPADPLEALKQILAAIDGGGDHFAVLQVDRMTPPGGVRDQYFRLAKVVHPDLPVFINRPDLRGDATRAFRGITVAHGTLSEPVKRAAYLASLDAPPAGAQNAATDSAPSAAGRLEAPVNLDVARIYLHRGRQMLQRRDWAGAQDSLDMAAHKLTDKELIECKVMLGWATFNNTATPERERIDRPRDLWTEVTKATPVTAFHAQANYYLAVWHKLHGEMKQVMPLLDQCLLLDPKHIEAAREKRLLERRRTGTFEATTSTTRNRRASKQVPAPAAASGGTGQQKVLLERKPTLLERLFGKRV